MTTFVPKVSIQALSRLMAVVLTNGSHTQYLAVADVEWAEYLHESG